MNSQFCAFDPVGAFSASSISLQHQRVVDRIGLQAADRALRHHRLFQGHVEDWLRHDRG